MNRLGILTPLLCLLLLAGQGQEEEKEEMKWTPYGKALEEAKEKKLGLLIYFPEAGQRMDHGVFLKKGMGMLSHEHPCVKIPYTPDEPIREALGITDAPTVIITDWYGNEVKRLVVDRPNGDFDFKQIEGTFKKVPAIMKEINKKLSQQVKKGEKAIERKKYRSAIETLRKVMGYKGYDAAHEAQAALEKAFMKGKLAVAGAESMAEESPKKAIERLKEIAKEFEDTPVEDEAWDAIERIDEGKG